MMFAVARSLGIFGALGRWLRSKKQSPTYMMKKHEEEARLMTGCRNVAHLKEQVVLNVPRDELNACMSRRNYWDI